MRKKIKDIGKTKRLISLKYIKDALGAEETEKKFIMKPTTGG